MSDDAQQPGMWQAMIRAIRGWGQRGNTDQRAADAQAASEQVSKALPQVVMPRGAIEEKRRRMAMLDAMTRER